MSARPTHRRTGLRAYAQRHADFVERYFRRPAVGGSRAGSVELRADRARRSTGLSDRAIARTMERAGRLRIDEDYLAMIPSVLLQQHCIIPMRDDDGSLLVATSRRLTPQTLASIESATGQSPRLVFAPEPLVREALARRMQDEDVLAISSTLPSELSAQRVVTFRHVLLFGGFATLILVALALRPLQAVIGLIAVSLLLYGISTIYKLSLLTTSLWSRRHVPVREQADAGLPRYTLLVPLYKEGGVLPRLIAGISAMDYPKDRLEVFLLLEEDDLETRRLAEATPMPAWVHPLVVPEGKPKGKPRALNYGLLYASGELCVIFDAEDIPDPSQLRAAASAFAQSGPDVACVQCSLAFYNGPQNVLTNLFTVEYATWFEFVLPALFHSGAPLPLGGTSNHFRVDVLRDLGGWDAYNVTEDADLGMRLARAGHRTVTVDSVTLEEANSQLWNWVRQRTRWNKGHMVTYLVHMRHPWRLWREVGPIGFFSWQMLVGGSVLTQLLNPIFWLLLVVWYASGWELLRTLFPLPLLYAGNVLLLGSTFVYVTFGALACLRNRHYYAAPYALLLPLYWGLQSFAAYRAIYQVVFSPHVWEKTEHNLITASALRRSGLLGPGSHRGALVREPIDEPVSLEREARR